LHYWVRIMNLAKKFQTSIITGMVLVATIFLPVFPVVGVASAENTTKNTFPFTEVLSLSESAKSVQYTYGDYIRYWDPTPHNITTDDIIVAIIDTGIDDSHLDFEPGQIIAWKDFYAQSESPSDGEGHGTACAGIIGGTGKASNGKYAGTFSGVKLLIIKAGGPETDDAFYFAANFDADNDAKPDVDVISCSFGGPYLSHYIGLNEAHIEAINYVRSKGIVVVASAGNGIPNGGIKYPSEMHTLGCSPNVITVGACDKNGEPLPVIRSDGSTSNVPGASYTNLDPEVTAWGVNVPAARSKDPSWTGSPAYPPLDGDSNYTSFSGTSAAAPHISGVAARLIYEAYLLGKKVTPGDIENLILKTADHYPIADITYGGAEVANLSFPYLIEGYGHVNITRALKVLRGELPMPEGDPIDNLHYNISKTFKETYTNDTQIEGDYCNGGMIYQPDLEKPTITDNSPASATTGDPYIFNATVTDNVNVDKVFVEYWFGEGEHQNVSMTRVGTTDYYEKEITIPSDSPVLHYFISANDTSNNWNKTSTKDVTVSDNDKPQITNIQATPQPQVQGGYINITGYDNLNLTMTRIAGTDNYYYNATYDGAGTYAYKVWANDASGNMASASDTFEVTSGVVPKLVITAPAEADENTQFTVTVTADSVAVEDVDVTFNSVVLQTDVDGKATFTSPEVTGDTNLQITATKTDYEAADPATITVKDAGGNIPPTVAITDPSEGSNVNGPIHITGTASDLDGNETIQNVQVKIANETGHIFINWDVAEKEGNDWSNWKYYWDVTAFNDGNYTISVRAYDGETYSDIVQVNVTVCGQGGSGQITIINSAPVVESVDIPASSYTNTTDHAITVSGQVYDANWDDDVAYVNVTIYKPDKLVLSTGSAILSGQDHDDGYLTYSYTFTLPKDSPVGTYTVNVTAVDTANAKGYNEETFKVVEEVVPIEITYTDIGTQHMDYLKFPPVGAGNTSVSSTNDFIIHNNQNDAVDVWFDISDFVLDSDNVIPTVGNMKIWIEGQPKPILYNAVDTYLGTIPANGQMQIKLEIVQVPELLKTGIYTTTFGVYGG